MPSRILIRKDGREVSTVPLASPMTVGRHPGSSIQLEDKMMSREHARITVEGSRVFVTDMSQNGVLLGGTRIPRGEPREVRHGDALSIPSHELVFQLWQEAVEVIQTLALARAHVLEALGRVAAALHLKAREVWAE